MHSSQFSYKRLSAVRKCFDHKFYETIQSVFQIWVCRGVGERGTLGGNFLKEVPSKPPSRTFKQIYIMNATIRTAFKLGFVGGFEITIVGTGVPDGPLPNGQKYLSVLRYFGSSRTPVPTAPFFSIYSRGTINCRASLKTPNAHTHVTNICYNKGNQAKEQKRWETEGYLTKIFDLQS